MAEIPEKQRQEEEEVEEVSDLSISLPQKKFYRQRAHSNPLNDHSFD